MTEANDNILMLDGLEVIWVTISAICKKTKKNISKRAWVINGKDWAKSSWVWAPMSPNEIVIILRKHRTCWTLLKHVVNTQSLQKSFLSNSSLWQNIFNSWLRNYVFYLLYSKTHLYLQGMFWSKALPLESLYLQRFSGVQKVSHIFLPLNAASKPDQLKRLVFVVFLLVQKLSSTVVWGTLFWGKMPKNRLKKEAHENFLMLW